MVEGAPGVSAHHGTKEFQHPVVGRVLVDYETITLPGDPDVALFIYSAEPGSPSQKRLDLLTDTALPHPRGPMA